MAVKIIDDTALTAIANSIRAKGVTGTFTPEQMATAIDNIPTGGGGSSSEVEICQERSNYAYYVQVPGATKIAFDYEVKVPAGQTKAVVDDYRSVYYATSGPTYGEVDSKGRISSFLATSGTKVLDLDSPAAGTTGTVEVNASAAGEIWLYTNISPGSIASGYVDLRLKNFRAV